MLSHVLEIRWRGYYILASLVLAYLAAYTYRLELLYVVVRPLVLLDQAVVAVDLTEIWITLLRVSGYVALALCLPGAVYHVWSFVVPGRYLVERHTWTRALVWLVVAGLVDLVAVYAWVLPLLCLYFAPPPEGAGATDMIVTLHARVGTYTRFSLGVCMASVAASTLPLLGAVLVRLSGVSWWVVAGGRRWAYVACVLLAALLSPPDLVAQGLVALALLAIWEAVVVLTLCLTPLPGEEWA